MKLKDSISLYVFIMLPTGEIVKAGRLLSKNLFLAHKEGFFQYSPSYLAHSRSFPLDPIHLPLSDKVYHSNNLKTGVHSVFTDSLPDSWGLSLLAQKGKVPRTAAPAHLLAILGGNGMGGTFFSEKDVAPVPSPASIPFSQLEEALDETTQYEKYAINIENLKFLPDCASSPGGAWPKLLVGLLQFGEK
jgi:serine/threonine-protein kinase HipA